MPCVRSVARGGLPNRRSFCGKNPALSAYPYTRGTAQCAEMLPRTRQEEVPATLTPRARVSALSGDSILLGLAVFCGVVWLVFDQVPRFLQGDSISYLGTRWHGWMPPDRSWVFGLFVNSLWRITGGFLGFIVIQILLYAVTAYVVARTAVLKCPGAAAKASIAWLFIAFACVDPLTNLYVRFYMSDIVAVCAFALWICLAARFVDGNGWQLLALALLMLALIVVAVFTRVAYVPIGVGTLMLYLAARWRTLVASQRLKAAVAALMPILAALLIAFANFQVFRDTGVTDRPFLTRMSSLFLLGVFAPAIDVDDFERAGVPLSREEFEALKLDDYSLRIFHVWGSGPNALRVLLKEKLKVEDDYSPRLDAAAGRVVASAAARHPAALAEVYLTNLRHYFTPSEWHREIRRELGVDRQLPPDFLETMNSLGSARLYPEMTAAPSPLLKLFLWTLPFYPIYIAVSAALAAVLILRRSTTTFVALGCAAVWVTLLLAPLYSNYVIPRYLLATVFFGHLAIAVTITACARWAARART